MKVIQTILDWYLGERPKILSKKEERRKLLNLIDEQRKKITEQAHHIKKLKY